MDTPSLRLASLLITTAALAAACGEREQTVDTPEPAAAESPAEPVDTAYREVKWEDLIPKEDLDALLDPPDYLDTIAEGSVGDEIPGELASAGETTGEETEESRYQQALTSTRIKPEYDRQRIRIPGFVVPLEFDEEQTITSFFLVPYFGACLHLPPPPPNQVIHASFPEGMQVEALYDPFYVEGELRTLRKDSELGTAAYSMRVEGVYPYEE